LTLAHVTDPPSHCRRPFEWFEVHPDGSVFLCCPAWLKRPAGNLLRQSVAEIWNGPVALELRKSLLNDSFHNCNRRLCPRLAPLLREDSPGTLQGKRPVKDSEVFLPRGPVILNLCFDRSCNLSCPSCRTAPRAATAEERENMRLMGRRLREAGEGVRGMRLSGYGDPFAAPGYREFLASIRPEEFPALRSLALHSNGLLFDEAGFTALGWLREKLDEVEISVDAADGPTYALNRRGGDFERLLANLEFIRSLQVRTSLSFVVQANNFRQIPEFADLAGRYGFRAYFSRLVNWGTFSRQEYRVRAVHLEDHPMHGELKKILAALGDREDVDPGNLGSLA